NLHQNSRVRAMAPWNLPVITVARGKCSVLDIFRPAGPRYAASFIIILLAHGPRTRLLSSCPAWRNRMAVTDRLPAWLDKKTATAAGVTAFILFAVSYAADVILVS